MQAQLTTGTSPTTLIPLRRREVPCIWSKFESEVVMQDAEWKHFDDVYGEEYEVRP